MAKSLDDVDVRKAIQEALESASNTHNNLQAIASACAVAGTIGICLFFIINAQVEEQTSDLRTELAVIKSKFIDQREDVKATHESVKELTKKLDGVLFNLLKDKNNE